MNISFFYKDTGLLVEDPRNLIPIFDNQVLEEYDAEEWDFEPSLRHSELRTDLYWKKMNG